jgi:hypothetical protein
MSSRHRTLILRINGVSATVPERRGDACHIQCLMSVATLSQQAVDIEFRIFTLSRSAWIPSQYRVKVPTIVLTVVGGSWGGYRVGVKGKCLAATAPERRGDACHI